MRLLPPFLPPPSIRQERDVRTGERCDRVEIGATEWGREHLEPELENGVTADKPRDTAERNPSRKLVCHTRHIVGTTDPAGS